MVFTLRLSSTAAVGEASRPTRSRATFSRPTSPRADIDHRAAVDALAGAVQAVVTEGSVGKAFVDQGHTGERAAAAPERHGIELEIVILPGAERGFGLPPRRWVGERSFARAIRFRRLVKDDERLPATVAGLHSVASACLMSRDAAQLATEA